jgi:AcrR family transcriptional regulator
MRSAIWLMAFDLVCVRFGQNVSYRSQFGTRIAESTHLARRPQTNPRKSASQARSRATVDALVEATARVLIRDGYDRASTNKIAAVAGVSIGSLYQYFPSKEALVSAVIERHTQELSDVVRGAMDKVARSPIEVAARELVSAAIDAHRADPKLHRVLAEQVPRVGRLENIDAVERNGRLFFREYLQTHSDEIGMADLDLAAFIVITTVEALTHNAVLRRPDILEEKAEVFVDEVTQLVLRFLRVPLAGRPRLRASGPLTRAS